MRTACLCSNAGLSRRGRLQALLELAIWTYPTGARDRDAENGVIEAMVAAMAIVPSFGIRQVS
jgi:hypothetical protein